MSFSFHQIDNSREFLHSDLNVVVKHYNLYLAIKALKYAVTDEDFDINSVGYGILKENLEEAMLNEIDIMDNMSLIMETYLNLGVLVTVEPNEKRYTNLFKLFNYLVKVRSSLEYASRISSFTKVVESRNKLIIENLEQEKNIEYLYSDNEFNFEFKLNTLQTLNLQANDQVPLEKLGKYVLSLSDNIPLENVIKNNLFNFQTFSNSELYFHTMLPDVDDLYLKVKSMETLMESSHYFWIETDNRYETFRNYIDFSYLETIVLYMIKHFKAHLDKLDSVPITQMKDPLSFYPSGQEEIFHVIAVMRKILGILAIVFNLSKTFKEQHETKKEIERYKDALGCIERGQITVDNIYSKLPDMTVEQVDRILAGQGTDLENMELEKVLRKSEECYTKVPEVIGTINQIVEKAKEASKGYNPVVTDGKESGLDLDDISKKLIDIMEDIISLIEDIRTLLGIIKGNNLPFFQFLYSINWVFDLSFLYRLADLISALNRLLYEFNCLLNAIACFASYIKDMYDTLKTFYNNENKYDLTEYFLGAFTLEMNGKAIRVTTDMIKENNTEVLSILSDTLSDTELARVADALSFSAKNLKSDCILSWIEGVYQDALQSMKASIKAGQRCKVTPGGRIRVDAGLRFNLGVDIPDLRFRFRNCTGAN